ncbi:38206_t:CDS:2, partial [Gigaspora margarita]
AYPDYIEEFSIEIADYNPIGPTGRMSLPETIPKRNNGVLHSVKVHPERNPHRLYAKYVEELNMEDIPIPVPVSIPVYKKFEENNPDISLCIYEWHNQNKCLEFHYLSEKRGAEFKEVNLLVILETEDIENPRSHYCIIKDLHRLVYNHSKHKEKKYLCRFCLKVISTEKGFNEHKTNPKKCLGVNKAPQVPKVPTMKKSIKEFSNFKCMQPNPYRIFWDLECLTEKLTPEENIQLTHTEKIQRHKPCGYCYVVVRIDSSLNYEIISYDLYRGPDALEKFIDAIKKELLEIQTDLSAPAEMIMEPNNYKRYNEATECWICMKPFVDPSLEILQQFEEAKYRLLELKEWEACMRKDYPEKKNIQKEY